MIKINVIVSLLVYLVTFQFQVTAAPWYTEDFDKFKDGDIVGQDDWKIAMNQKTCQIQGKVKHGDVGKSVLVQENTKTWMKLTYSVIQALRTYRPGVDHVL